MLLYYHSHDDDDDDYLSHPNPNPNPDSRILCEIISSYAYVSKAQIHEEKRDK